MIHGRHGREPIGARLVMGKKKPTGHGFVDKDRFSIMTAREARDGRRDVHPDFGWYDALPPESRRSVVCTIAHARWEDALIQRYHAQMAPPDPRAAIPPGRRPWCTGDGRDAMRWRHDPKGGEPHYQPCECGGDGGDGRAACIFRARTFGMKDGKQTANPLTCTVMTIVRFRLSLPDHLTGGRPCPTPIVEFASKGESTHDAFRGLRDNMDQTAAALGVHEYSPIGYQFAMTMREVVHPKTPAYPYGRRFWTVDVSPTISAADFLLGAAERQRALSDGGMLLLPAPIDHLDVADALDVITP